MTSHRLPARVRLADSVRVRIGPERGFVFDERTGRVFTLNATAALAAARLEAETSCQAAVNAVVAAFDVEPAAVERDLARFIDALVEEGLAHVEGRHG
jgi:hypothetical protein